MKEGRGTEKQKEKKKEKENALESTQFDRNHV
jgi:hypothetical protein